MVIADQHCIVEPGTDGRTRIIGWEVPQPTKPSTGVRAKITVKVIEGRIRNVKDDIYYSVHTPKKGGRSAQVLGDAKLDRRKYKNQNFQY